MTGQAVATGQRQGLVLTGEFLSMQEGEPKQRKDGSGSWTPVFVRLLVQDQSERVEFGSMADAIYWLEGEPERGDLVSLPVRARGYQGSVYYSGLRRPTE